MKRRCGHWHRNFWGIGAVLVCFLLLLSSLRIVPADAQQPDPADAQQAPPTADINTEQELDCIEQELDNRIGAFFTAIMEGNTESAFQEILRQSPLNVGRPKSIIAGFPSQLDTLQTDVGNICGWEKYETKRIGENVIGIQYIAKHEQAPLFWVFVFYRTPSTTSSMTMSDPNAWVITQIKWKADL